MRGVVGYQQPGKALFLQGEGRALRVLTEQDTKVNVGDVVDAVGFPVIGESAPMLRDAVFYRVGTQAPVTPIPLDTSVRGSNMTAHSSRRKQHCWGWT